MNLKSRQTNAHEKIDESGEFITAIFKQVYYGGSKYSLGDSDKEAGDYIVELFPEFVESTILKYLLRWRQQKREEDLIKIATYVFMMWIRYFTGDVAEENRKISKKLREAK